MSTRAGKYIAMPWTCSLLFLSGSLVLSGAWACGLNQWPAYLEIPLFVISTYFLLMAVSVTLHAQPDSAGVDTNVLTLLESLPFQTLVSDETGRLKHANSAFRKYAGSSLWKARHQDLFASVHPDDERYVRKVFGDGIAQRRSFSIEFRHRRADGSFRRFEARFQRLEGSSANLDPWLGVLVEMKDRASMNDEAHKTEPKLHEALASNHFNGDENPFSEAAINQLTAILVNSQACLRFLAADPANLSSVVVSMQRILRDAKEMSSFLKRSARSCAWEASDA